MSRFQYSKDQAFSTNSVKSPFEGGTGDGLLRKGIKHRKRLHQSISVFLFLILCLGFTVTVFSQSFDYQSKPRLNFRFSDAAIDLHINPDEGNLHGSVTYTLKATVNGADTLVMEAADIKIDSVLAAGKLIPYKVQNNRLNIILADSSVIDQAYTVKILYHAKPHFGLLKDSDGTLWTSFLPQSNRHWLPGINHPRVAMTTTCTFTVPQQYAVAAPGVKTDDKMLASGNRKVTFRTAGPIPATAIGFAVGMFHEEATSYGIKRIVSYTEPGSANAATQQQIIQKAKEIISQIEEKTGVKYPYQQLHLVMLNDHYWEEKPYGASVIFMYKNRGNWESQLRWGLYGQWFGVYQREEQWGAAAPIHLLQAALHFNLSDQPAMLKKSDEPQGAAPDVYDNFSVANWNFWQQYSSWNDINTKTIASRSLSQILQQGAGVFTPDDYTSLWYKLSGQPVINTPAFKQNDEMTSRVSDSVRYRVDFLPVAGQSSLLLTFKAEQGSVQGPVTLPVDIITGGARNSSTVKFSGLVDTVSVSLPAGTRNVRLKVPDGQKIILDEHKPVSYALYQLQHAQTTAGKTEAARELGDHADDPDLQLAITDFMKKPMEPEVEAALLTSFGAITNGANGTEKRFLDALDSKDMKVRMAALNVLTNYKKNDAVTSRIKQLALNEPDTSLSNQALRLYMQQVDSTEALQFTNTLVKQDTAGTKAIRAIGGLAASGSPKSAIKLAGFYVDPVYSYSIRVEALNILANYDTSEASWKKRLTMLMNDSDPRIRFWTVKNLPKIPGANAASILGKYKPLEYDARVVGAMGNE